MTERRAFDATTMPLDGVQLVEASAGTGKTFSLAALYLRLIVQKQLAVREILVVTFTRAATQELRERIRRRLADAARIARQPDSATGNAEDSFAEALVSAAPESREAVAHRLTEAANAMDEAAITTIHGFSQRAAQENAFDSALPFDRGEQVDDGPLYREVVADYWRAQVFGAGGAPGFLEWWPAPQSLAKALAPLWQQPHAELAGPDEQGIVALAKKLRRAWKKDGAAFADKLRACWSDKALKAQSLKKAIEAIGDMDDAIALLEVRLAAPDAIPALPDWVAHLHDADTQFLKKQRDRGEALFSEPLAQQLRQLQPLAALAALRHAHTAVRDMATARKRARRQYSFADMISALHEAISEPQTGARLAEALHRTWPWALVDEFQDTDPLQYEILRRIYHGRARGGLFLIGDPKQAIYGFRGGDVFAYLDAAADAGDQVWSLDTNYRSTSGLLKAVESLFRAPGDDAFLIAGIDYQTVRAGRGRQRTLLLDGKPLAAMTLWQPGLQQTTKEVAQAVCGGACVAHIRRLLDPHSGAELCEEDPASGWCESRPLAPRDIAVLVNTNSEAAQIQRALSRLGIAAVCLHQQSVFASAEARDLLHLLKAAANPMDEGLLRAALAGELLGYRLGDLVALAGDETRWQVELDRFQAAHERWRDSGVLAMLQPLIQSAAERLLGYEDGERRMSNFLQLAELLAEAESESFGMAGLLRWLRQAVAQAEEQSGDAEQLRLESDEALVRIVTVHKAKGLEYPVVMLPFAPWLGAKGKPDKLPRLYHDPRHRALVDRAGNQESLPQAIREARAEGLRLLYVALTRAELACFLPWCAANGTPDSALASLLHREDGIAPDFWGGSSNSKPLEEDLVRQRLQELAQKAGGAIAITTAPSQVSTTQRLPAAAPPQGEARTDLPRPRPPWSVYSFTRIVHSAGPGLADHGAEDERDQPGTVDFEAETLPELPGGTAFGSAVHGLLERVVAAQWPAAPATLTEDQRRAVAEALRRQGIAIPEDDPGRYLIEETARLVGSALHTPLPGVGTLAALPAHSLRVELEFVLRLGGGRLEQLLTLLEGAGYATRLPRERQAIVLAGLMHGYIDLVVERDQRFYVVDYKTNWLGSTVASYAPAALDESVRRHHYDLQYLIYLTALHRYLAVRLPDYDPDRHLGGAFYLFLRGMGPEAGERGIFFDRPDTALITALDALLDTGEAA